MEFIFNKTILLDIYIYKNDIDRQDFRSRFKDNSAGYPVENLTERRKAAEIRRKS